MGFGIILVLCALCFVLCALCFVLCALCFVLCALCFGQVQSTKHKVLFLFTLFRSWRWSKIAVSNETGTRRIVLLRESSNPEILGGFFRRLDCQIVVFAARRDRDLALHVSAIEFHVRVRFSQSIE